MITRLQYVILCRVEQGLPAFSRPLAPKTHPRTLQRRREALVDLYDRGFIETAKKNSVRYGPRLTLTGKRALKWIRHGDEYEAPYGGKGNPGYSTNAARVHRLREVLGRGEEITARHA
jgi:hypothetical protein